MVEVHLDLGDAAAREAGERVEPRRPVLLAGEEERVPRAPAVGVAELGREARVLLGPEAHARVRLRLGDLIPERLPVIAEGEDQVPRARDARRAAVRQRVARVPLDPRVEALLAKLLTKVAQHGARPSPGLGPARLAV